MTKRIIYPVKSYFTRILPKVKLFNGVKYILSVMGLSIILVLAPLAADFSSINQAQAAGTWWDKAQNGGLNQVGQAYGGGTPSNPTFIVINAIRIVLGFLGIIAVILILYAGFKWMTSRGNEEQVSDAKKILIAGVIGLVIILSAYIIANFVINQIYSATTGQPVIFP